MPQTDTDTFNPLFALGVKSHISQLSRTYGTPAYYKTLATNFHPKSFQHKVYSHLNLSPDSDFHNQLHVGIVIVVRPPGDWYVVVSHFDVLGVCFQIFWCHLELKGFLSTSKKEVINLTHNMFVYYWDAVPIKHMHIFIFYIIYFINLCYK